MERKEIKKTLITTTALGLAISSFFSANPNDVEISYKDKKQIRDIEDNPINKKDQNVTKQKHQITRNDVAKIVFSIASVIVLVFKMLVTTLIKIFNITNSHSLLISVILDTISLFIVIFTLFIVLFKLIYPEKSLKEFLSLKNIVIIFITSLIISLILNNLDLFKNQKIIMIIIESIASSIILFTSYAYVLNSNSKLLFGAKALIKTKKGRKTILIMFISIVIGCITKILLTKFNILVSITNLLLIIILLVGLGIIVVALRKRKLVNYCVEFPENVEV